jgi:hypothetical protein
MLLHFGKHAVVESKAHNLPPIESLRFQLLEHLMIRKQAEYQLPLQSFLYGYYRRIRVALRSQVSHVHLPLFPTKMDINK